MSFFHCLMMSLKLWLLVVAWLSLLKVWMGGKFIKKFSPLVTFHRIFFGCSDFACLLITIRIKVSQNLIAFWWLPEKLCRSAFFRSPILIALWLIFLIQFLKILTITSVLRCRMHCQIIFWSQIHKAEFCSFVTRTRCTGPYARTVRVEDDPIHTILSHDTCYVYL